jgi:TPR repeat protein
MKKYFYAINKVQNGPFSLDEILKKNLDKNTLVWCEGLPEWVKLSEISELNINRDPSLPPPIRVKGSGFLNKNLLKKISAIAFIVIALIASGLFLYPKWENEKKYEEALSVYMKRDSIQFDVFNELAIKNHTKSNFILGLYYNRINDSVKAKESLEKVIVKGNEVPALYALYLINPKDSSKYEKRIEENFASWVDAISQSDWLAQVYAGRIYEFGIGVEKDARKAVEFYEMASNNGSVRADFLLGLMYRDVEEIKDYEKSLSFLKKADELGHFHAAGQIGEIYQYGLGVEKDYEKSIFWYSKGAKMKDIYSQNLMGYFYSKGLGGVRENLDSAKYWYQLAVSNNQPQKLPLQQVEEIKKNSKDNLDIIKIHEIEEQSRKEEQLIRSQVVTRNNSSSNYHVCEWCGRRFVGDGYEMGGSSLNGWRIIRSSERIVQLSPPSYCSVKCASEAPKPCC